MESDRMENCNSNSSIRAAGRRLTSPNAFQNRI